MLLARLRAGLAGWSPLWIDSITVHGYREDCRVRNLVLARPGRCLTPNLSDGSTTTDRTSIEKWCPAAGGRDGTFQIRVSIQPIEGGGKEKETHD